MKAIMIGLGLTVLASLSNATSTIVAHFETCDHFIIDGPAGYTVVQWFSGHQPVVGDTLQTVLDPLQKATQVVRYANTPLATTVWVESFHEAGRQPLSEIKDPCQCQ